jgi:hydrogenase/urease accessory protein HupE
VIRAPAAIRTRCVAMLVAAATAAPIALAGAAAAVVPMLLLAPPAQAHDARPLSITILEQTDGVFRVIVRAPPTIESGNAPGVVWPESCDVAESAPLRHEPGSTSLVSCAGGLAGSVITIDYPLYNPSITTLFRLQSADGATLTAVLPPDELAWAVPVDPTWLGVAIDYATLGFEHIWGGPDHLLFVAGLLLLARLPRRVFWAVTGFTAAHSITLSLAALGWVRVPIGPVEAMIALSIVVLAAEIARDDTTSFSHRFPIVLSFAFGLLHGFGFASALGEIGLPRSEIATGLLFFNVGVEIGQLSFIAVAVAAYLAFRRIRAAVPGDGAVLAPDRLVPLCAYALGIPAAFWFVERTAAAFA